MDNYLTNRLTENNGKRQQQNENQFLDHFSNVFNEYQLMREFVLFRNQSITHLYVVPSDSSPFLWFGVMFVQKGLYRGIVLRFKVMISWSYPDSQIPKILFEAIPFHPLIDPMSGELNTSVGFNEWKTGTNKIWQIIDYANKVFNSYDLSEYLPPNELIDSNNCLNTEAIDLFKEDFEGFESRVKQTIRECNQKINESNTNDSNAIVFGVFNVDIHQELQNKLLSGVNVIEEMQLSDPTHPSVNGLSWVQSGSTKIFSKTGA